MNITIIEVAYAPELNIATINAIKSHFTESMIAVDNSSKQYQLDNILDDKEFITTQITISERLKLQEMIEKGIDYIELLT